MFGKWVRKIGYYLDETLYRKEWTRTKEAVKVEAELTRDVLAEGLAIMAADVKSHKEKSHSAVKALQAKFKILII